MKIGMRTPNFKKSIKARTTGKVKRKIKKALIPGYGKKGMGWVKDPKRAAYNKVYNKTSFSLFDLFKWNKAVSYEAVFICKYLQSAMENVYWKELIISKIISANIML